MNKVSKMNRAKAIMAIVVALVMTVQPFTPASIAYAVDKAQSAVQAAASSQGGAQTSGETNGEDEADGAVANDAAGQKADNAASAESLAAEDTAPSAEAMLAGEPQAQAEEPDSDEPAVVAATGYYFEDFGKLKTALESKNSTLTIEENSITEISTSDPAAVLIILSQAKPQFYCKAKIKANQSMGALSLTGSTDVPSGTGTKSLSFAADGLGNDKYPFSGIIADNNDSAVTITVPATLFGALDISNHDSSYAIIWAGQTDNGSDPSVNSKPMLASKVVGGSDDVTHALTVTVTLPNDGEHVQAATTSSLIGTVAGNIDLNATYKIASPGGNGDSNDRNATITQSGNVGLLVNTVESGKLSLKSFDDALKTVNITSTDGHAGFLVGQVKSGAAFSLACKVAAPGGIITASTKYDVQDADKDRTAAGGLIGKASGATVSIDAADDSSGVAFDASNLTVVAGNCGGIVGLAKGVEFTINASAHVKPAKTVGNGNSRSAGALFGEASFTKAVQFNGSNVELPDGLTVLAYDVAGGLFGILGFPEENPVAVEIGGDGASLWNVAATLSAHTSDGNNDIRTGSVGGLVGAVGFIDEGSKGKLSISKVVVNAIRSAGSKIGGVVGTVSNDAFLDVENTSVSASLPDSVASGFGGLVGFTKAGIDCAIAANNLAVSTPALGNVIKKGGGVIGTANSGTVVKLSGRTNLSGVRYDENNAVGQVVGAQDCALVFGTGTGSDSGWTLIRSADAYKIDDVAGYGEVLRLGGLGSEFITLDDTGKVTINGGAKLANDGAFSLGTVQDFAMLAITWQSKGVFSAVAGVSSANWESICGKNIALTNDINLTGTGITGLSRDNEKLPAFTGMLEGNSHKISLAVGEAYGMRDGKAVDDSSEGSGKIYHHQWLGLFAAFNGSASNITIDGTMSFKARAQIKAGALGATSGSGNVQLTGVQLNPTITVRNEDGCAVGNAFGAIEDGSGSITFGSGCKITSKINTPEKVAAKSYIGGAIGYISGNTASVVAQELAITGSITAETGNSVLPAGGFIAFIERSNSYKQVTISDLDVSGLQLSFTTGRDGSSATGGFLGYNWAQTETAIKGSDSKYAIRANGATLNANGAYGVGGLLYHAGGKLTVGAYAIDYSGATIQNVGDGTNAGRLGLLVCRGGKGNETGLSDSGAATSSLYLQSTAEWDTSYIFGSGDKAMKFEGIKAAYFDEWVADTIRTDGNDIFESNVNGVVSLHTTGNDGAGATVDVTAQYMDGDFSLRNTYVNRSTYGAGKQSNARSRYYYNLDRVIASGVTCSNGVTTPEGLLLWSVYNYADTAIRDLYFSKGKCSSNTITGAFDMRGLSYYPIDLYGQSVTISGATFTFYNSNIETLEAGSASVVSNKSTQASSQHKAMHCGLFRNLAVEGGNATLAATNVHFGGTIGKIDGASGVLVCGTVHGSTENTKSGTYTVRIENGTSSDALLNNLTITGFTGGNADEYAPLLLNSTGEASTLNVTGVSTSGYASKIKAASSLIGNVGNENAKQVSVSFSKIKLASKGDDAIFSKATLLQSFSYAETGSATYNFTKEECNNGSGWVTFGKEIDGTNEYRDEQLWYAESDHNDSNLTTDGQGTSAVVAGKDQFKNYLPYVATAYTKNGKYHEIAVNHQAVDIVEGCGTYGHPYVIRNAQQLKNVADIINSGKPSNTISVRVTTKQDQLCNQTATNEAVYKFSDLDWTSENGDPISATTMRYYFQSAYYKIANDIVLTDFAGLGTSGDCAFRGVIIGSDSAKLTLERSNAGSLNGLIKYSYGSVIKDLDIEYRNADGVTSANEVAYKEKSADYMPQAFFGGVIGCILGGDNIIDGVSITVPDGNTFSVRGSGSSNSNLVPIGGYVGVVAGGGVIFRKSNPNRSNSLNSWHDGSNAALFYDNDYLGRMLDGYAFSEGDFDLTNGDEGNYKINKIVPPSDDATRDIVTSDVSWLMSTGTSGTKPLGLPYYKTQTTIASAQGLLILSGIINSGAASGMVSDASEDTDAQMQGTRSYRGGTEQSGNYSFGNNLYGKVRNASYEHIGEYGNDAQSDFAVSSSDDMYAPGIRGSATLLGSGGQKGDEVAAQFSNEAKASTTNAPYLVSRYAANNMTSYICTAASPTNVVLYSSFEFNSNHSIDVRGYGSGYLGLSARYVTNAALDTLTPFNADSSKRTYSVNPLIYQIVGNGVMLNVDKQEKEYATDDYHTMGVGALFSTAGFGSVPNMPSAETFELVSNFTLVDSKLGIAYYGADGVTSKLLNDVDFSRTDIVGSECQKARLQSIFGVGGIAGMLCPDSVNFKGGKIVNVHSSNLTIQSPGSAGSLFGMAAFGLRTAKDTDEIGNYGRKNGNQHGYFVYAGSDVTDLQSLTMILNNCTYQNDTIFGGTSAGGLFGFLFAKTNGAYEASDLSVGKDSQISSTGVSMNNWLGNQSYVGGIIGYSKYNFSVGAANGKVVSIENVEIESLSSNKDASSAGGVIGYFESANGFNAYNVQVTATDSTKGVISSSNKNVGGILGRITPADGNSKIAIDSCVVRGVTLKTTWGYSGGIIGNLDKNGTLRIDNTRVENTVFDSLKSGGFVGYGNNAANDPRTLISNSKIVSSTFKGDASGAIVGETNSNHAWNNILVKGNIWEKVSSGKQGLLAGCVNSSCKGIKVAGVDVELLNSQTNAAVPSLYLRSSSGQEFTTNSFIAFTNYNDMTQSDSDSSSLYGATAADPYVNTLPVGAKLNSGNTSVKDGSVSLGVKSGSGTQSEVLSLFGDGMNPNLANPDKDGSITKTSTNVAGTFVYKNAPREPGKVLSASNNISTIGAQNTKSADYQDFNVLVITSGQAGLIDTYLDTVTNGGYSQAKAMGGDAVTASVQSLAYNGKGTLSDDTSGITPAVAVRNSGGSNMDFAVTSGFDNTQNRITLLTVTFTAGDNQKHVVYVPIVVLKMVQVDFTATLKEGTYFNPGDYASVGDSEHVLTSYGSSMTGYLTYQYNTELGTLSSFDWNSYLAAGGNMRKAEKTLQFNSTSVDDSAGKYPVGTQLILVDTAHDNKEYHYVVDQDGGISSLSLSDFYIGEGATKTYYQQRWMSDVMNASAQWSNDGAWVIESDVAKATASATLDGGIKYFRPWTDADGNDADRYTLTVDNNYQPEENFYLVVYFPDNSDMPKGGINGSLDSDLDITVPRHVNNKLRKSGTVDGKSGTPSTYNILSGYLQSLADNDTAGNEKQTLLYEDGKYKLKLDVSDTVKFSGKQLYNSDDQLYFRLNTSLASYESNNGSATQKEVSGFPTKSEGEAGFYVRSRETYYKWNAAEDSWEATSSQDDAKLSYGWSTDGNEMSLTLGKMVGDEFKAANLAKLRTLLSADGATGDKSFTIDMQMTVDMDDAAHVKGIESSMKEGEDAYTRLIYRGTLSTSVDGLDHSAMTCTVPGNKGFYRASQGTSTVSLTARSPYQLGINVDDLALADGTINATGTYDLSGMSNLDDVLKSAQSVEYTISLQRRKDDGGYEQVTGDVSKYLSIADSRFRSDGGSTYVWTDTGLTSRTRNSPQFMLPLTFKVDINVEGQDHIYANYRIVLEAKLVGENGAVLNTPSNGSDYITYTLTRVNLKGI